MRAWSSIPATSTHHLVLEDDAQLPDWFEEHAVAAAAAVPDAAVSFHVNWSCRSAAAVRLAALRGERWAAAANEFTPTVALLLPADVGAGFADYARRHGGTWADDVVMARYLKSVGVASYVTVPNLVEHGDYPSVTENDYHGLRLSACYSPAPPDIDWRPRGTPANEVLPFFKFGMAHVVVRDRDTGRALTVGWERGAHRIGLDLTACRRSLEQEAGSLELLNPLPGRISRPVATALWNTAYALGFLGRRPDRFPGVEAQLAAWTADPLVAHAAGTLGPGGLCMELSAGELAAIRRPLAALAWQALCAGLRAHSGSDGIAGAGPRSRSGGRPARAGVPAAHSATDSGHVVVAGPEGDELGRCLTAGLADHGRQVTPLDDDGSPGFAAKLRRAARTAHGIVHLTRPGASPEDCAAALREVLAVARTAGARHVVHLTRYDTPAAEEAESRTAGARHVVHLTRCDTSAAEEAEGTGRPVRATVLRLGAVYGPQIDCEPLNGFVSRSLVKQPITVSAAHPEARYVHVWDVTAVVNQVLDTDAPPRFRDLRSEAAVTPVDLARLVAQVIKPVPVKVTGDGGPDPGRGTPAAHVSGPAKSGWPAITLADGLRTVAQWLAYEAG
ncbi:hypothetical protein Ssi02_30690 [Sinosporangium siamense]|uniref:Uncharacterized protein n=2 Tax=Sinosporangium siamense TaxID=1367973 RepID=A0A919V6U9_9ACTN|nr:hypothetical protein Ssi02_30690 [Sinosporangium siamense]